MDNTSGLLSLPKSTTYTSSRGPSPRLRKPLKNSILGSPTSPLRSVRGGAAVQEVANRWRYYASIPITVVVLLVTILYLYKPTPSTASTLDLGTTIGIGVSDQEYNQLFKGLSACEHAQHTFLPRNPDQITGYQQAQAIRRSSIGLSTANLGRLKKGWESSNVNDTIQASMFIIGMLNQTILATQELIASIDTLERDIRDSQVGYIREVEEANKIFGKAIILGSVQDNLDHAEQLRATVEACRGAYEKAVQDVRRWRTPVSAFSDKLKRLDRYFKLKIVGIRRDTTGKTMSVWSQTFAEDMWKLIDEKTLSRSVVEELTRGL